MTTRRSTRTVRRNGVTVKVTTTTTTTPGKITVKRVIR